MWENIPTNSPWKKSRSPFLPDMKKFCLLLALTLCLFTAAAQSSGDKQLREAVGKFFSNYTLPGYSHYGKMKADSVRVNKKSRTLSVYANRPFYSQPLTPERVKAIHRDLTAALPKAYRSYRLTVFGNNCLPLDSLVPNFLRQKKDASRLWGNTDFDGNPWVSNISKPYAISAGLSGRHFMLWDSHGYYNKFGEWKWQRPYLFCTTEDLLSQSFVLPYLLPMLENAGAVVCMPRERDAQTAEAVVDNDAPKRQGSYTEVSRGNHIWTTAPDAAFAHPGGALTDSILPFRLGTARLAPTTPHKSHHSTATWTPRLPRAGRYAVYVSYPSHPDNVCDALYTVHHRGGQTQFRINQQMGGGTWVYLGTFSFDGGESKHGRVVLSNHSSHRGVVGADAVRFGGGMGQTERYGVGTSGMPRHLEAARYHAQWSGMPDTLFNTTDDGNDYTDDLRARSYMLNHLAGGSPYLPATVGKRVPIELSLALHTDAGVRSGGRIYGSLAIFTSTRRDSVRHYPSGISRSASADLGAMLLNGLTADLPAKFGIPWTRRELWDRNYSETRTPDVPAAILELLSHQNFTDMKFAHDPIFKFHAMRSVYKSLLRYSAFTHGDKKRSVQPLPPSRFSALLTPDGSAAELSWAATPDPLEASAQPTAYVVYTKQDGKDFDNGRLVKGHTAITLPIDEGRQYSFRVTAVNDGGESFPSEELSVYKAPGDAPRVLIINGFCRLSGPARVATADSLGFDLRRDIGVPYLRTTAFCGAQRNFQASAAGGEGPESLGFSSALLEGKTVAGNTFDYPTAHGKAIAATRLWSFSSCSREAAVSGAIPLKRYAAIDYIAGLERDAPHNFRPFKTFSPEMRQLLSAYLNSGGRLLVSGAHIASDMQQTAAERDFIANVLKYRFAGTDTVPTALIGTDSISAGAQFDNCVQGLSSRIPLHRTLNAEHYAVQSPDIILPASPQAFSAFIYGSGQGAGIAYRGTDYRVIATGFPLECISDSESRDHVIASLLHFLLSP